MLFRICYERYYENVVKKKKMCAKTDLFYERMIYIVLRKDYENWIDTCILLLNCFLFTQFEMKNPKS